VNIKNLIITIIILFLSLLSYGQWDNNGEVFKCAQFFGDSIIFLNDFKVKQIKRKEKDDPEGKIWEIYLMKGNEYRFVLCSKHQSIIEMKLYDDITTHNYPYRTTFIDGKDIKYFDYICKKSDVYKISIKFKAHNLMGVPLNAIGILGFIKKVKIK